MYPMMCVTGATGFIAGHVTERLLASGCTVRGTVRNLHSADANALQRLPRGDNRLELVEADLLEPAHSMQLSNVAKPCSM